MQTKISVFNLIVIPSFKELANEAPFVSDFVMCIQKCQVLVFASLVLFECRVQEVDPPLAHHLWSPLWLSAVYLMVDYVGEVFPGTSVFHAHQVLENFVFFRRPLLLGPHGVLFTLFAWGLWVKRFEASLLLSRHKGVREGDRHAGTLTLEMRSLGLEVPEKAKAEVVVASIR